MLLETISNISISLDQLAGASSHGLSLNEIAALDKADKLRIINEVLQYIPFTDTYSDVFENGWSWRAGLNFFRDAVLLGAIGWFIAWLLERRHLKNLSLREDELKHIKVEVGPKHLVQKPCEQKSEMLVGSVVLSHDSFRSITIIFTKIFGGNIRQYERLFSRARRESIIRLKEQAAAKGFERVVNLKIVSAKVKHSGPKSVEIVAYGTGVVS